MSNLITVTHEDILQEIKLSCKVPEMVEQLITHKIIETAAKDAGIQVSDEDLQKTADTLRLINRLQSAEETWKWLEKHSLSINNFEDITYRTILSGKLAKHLFDAQVEVYFAEHQLDYAGVVMYEVILDDEDLAIELFYAIQEGEISFHDVASKYIQDTELRRKGGYKGLVRRKESKPEISAAVFAAKPPQILKPIVTSKGIHIISVEEIIEPKLDEKLSNQIISDLFADWLKQQIEKTEITQDF